ALLRRQHRRWLIQDQRRRSAEEQLDDLELLALADAQRGDDGAGIEVEAKLLAELSDPLLGGCAGAMRGPEDHVLEHREALNLPQVLVDDPDSGSQRVTRRAEAPRPPVDLDHTAVRAVVAAEHRDQRCLAGSVLAQQRVYLAAAHVEVDAIVGQHPVEPLRQTARTEKDVAGYVELSRGPVAG